MSPLILDYKILEIKFLDIFCDAVCYQERKGGQFPYPTVFESTGPKYWPKPGQNEGQSYLHSMTYDQLDREGNAGHSSSMTVGNRRRKSQMIGQTL